ncbi:MAG: hypothetical protein ACOZIN_13415 [Myxococcota bacterium]
MGFSVENVLVRGRPSDNDLEAWVRLALPRLRRPELQFPGERHPRFVAVNLKLEAAGRLDAERAEDLTLLWIEASDALPSVNPDQSLMSFGQLLRMLGIKKRDPMEWAMLRETATLPRLPQDPAGADAARGNPFLLSLALIAKSHGHDAAFFADASVSDSGCLVIPDRDGVTWTEADCSAKRQRANALLQTTFPGVAPDIDELQWVGPGKSYWSRPLVRAGRRVDSWP